MPQWGWGATILCFGRHQNAWQMRRNHRRRPRYLSPKNAKILRFCPMRIPRILSIGHIRVNIQKKNVWNEKIGLNFECCEAFVLQGTASSKPKWKLRWFCPMRQWRTIKKGNKDSFRSPNSLSSALSSGARCSAGGWLPVPTEVRPAKTTEASHATQLVRLLDSVALRVASRASRMKCSGRCSNLKHRPDAWIAENPNRNKKRTHRFWMPVVQIFETPRLTHKSKFKRKNNKK